MPANQSTPEVTRADEARRLIEKLAGADIDVSGTAAIGITSADIIAANDWLSATPARGGDELRATAQFLSDRLDDLEWMDGDLESTLRDFMGHVDPAHARLKSALASTDMAGAGEGNSRPTSPLGHARACLRTAGETSHVQIRRVDLQWIIDRFPVCDPDTAPPVEGLTGQRELVARIIDPDAFHCHQGVYDHSLRLAYTEAEAKQRADEMHGADCDAAHAKADEVLAVLGVDQQVLMEAMA